MDRRTRMATITLAALAAMAVQRAQGQTWANAQLLNEPGEAGSDVKTARVVAAAGGGFHSIYHVNNKVRYRRFNGTSLLSPVNVFPGTNFMANGYLAEALNGDIHVVLEDWAGGGPEVRWYKSINNGASFPSTLILSASGGTAKHPHIAPYGTGSSSNLVMSYFRSGTTGGGDKELFHARYTGSAWSAEASMNSSGNSEYEVFGICRSPADGSVYRSFTNSGQLRMRRYIGQTWWQPEIPVDNTVYNNDDMHNRQRIAVNAAGQVMLIWDQGGGLWSMLYTPGYGFGARTLITTNASWGQAVCTIPGTNNFYCAYPRDGADHVVGQRWMNGAWQGYEEIANGLVWDFSVGPDLSAGADGTLYCVWEYWHSGKPQQYYSTKAPAAAGSTGTIAGTVKDQFGVGVVGAGMYTSANAAASVGASGAYSTTTSPGTYTAYAIKPYYTPQSVGSVQVAQNQTVQVNFTITGQAPAAVSALTAVPGNTKVTLHWTNPNSGQLTGVRVVFKIGSDPANADDGTVVLDDTSGTPGDARSFVHTNLTNGQSYHYKVYAYFQDSSRFYSSGAAATTAPFGPADHDHDGDVDMADLGHFQTCMTGSFNPQNDPNCQDARFDADDDVDSLDLQAFKNCLRGAGVYADPQCAG